jgi:hypothetical protein
LRSGHAGYAYFTLDCTDAVIRTSSCGDADSISMEAPDGFRYQWSKRENRNLIVSTDRVLTVPANDTATYFCLVDYIGIDGCSFELSTLVRPRIPFADFEMKWEPQRCQNRVVFTNKSRVLTKVDGKIIETDEPCETFYWSVDGIQYESQDENIVVTFPKEGGSFTMHLMTGISKDACLDDTTFTFVVPPISDTVDSLYKEKCEADVEFFADKYIVMEGVYVDNDTTWCGCDSLTVLDLKFLPTPEAELIYDTICSEKDYVFNGAVYNESGVYESWLKTKELGCDSLVILNLTKTTPISATISNDYRYVCADDTLYLDYSYDESLRHPVRCSLLFGNFEKSAGFVDQTGVLLDTINNLISVHLPDSCRPNKYSVTVVFEDTLSFCRESVVDVDFDVYYSSSILDAKFGNVVTYFDSAFNGGYTFVESEYHWYRNDSLLVDDTLSYVYLGEGETFNGNDCYYLVATRKDDGVQMRTCEICPGVVTAIDDVYDDDHTGMLDVTMFMPGAPIKIKDFGGGYVRVYSFVGQLVGTYSVDSGSSFEFDAPDVGGFYLLHIVSQKGNFVHKIWVK